MTHKQPPSSQQYTAIKVHLPVMQISFHCTDHSEQRAHVTATNTHSEVFYVSASNCAIKNLLGKVVGQLTQHSVHFEFRWGFFNYGLSSLTLTEILSLLMLRHFFLITHVAFSTMYIKDTFWSYTVSRETTLHKVRMLFIWIGLSW